MIVPLTVLDKLGYARYAASNWCFVAESSNTNPRSSPETIAFYLCCWKAVGDLDLHWSHPRLCTDHHTPLEGNHVDMDYITTY